MQDIMPLNYRIHLEPNIDQFTFNGIVNIELNALVPVTAITLNILDITIKNCRIKQDQIYADCRFESDSDKEEMQITLPSEMSDKITIEIEYQGNINNLMAGFYRSKYDDNGTTRYIAVTQFEESDARRAFPCMDHPQKKAIFSIEIDIAPNLTAISNEDVLSQTRLENGKIRVVFKDTPRMSTYLVFFGVGKFNIRNDPNDSRVRTVTLPGTDEFAMFGSDFGQKALKFCEQYYDIPYPLSKMDLIAIPDFAFGAMENWGAITFRENLLLYYPESTSESGKKRICEVIAHEIAHQWFGNLVSPSDWKYLWLNESFATYFGYGVVAHYYPDWEIWEQFLYGMTASAMSRDALKATFPIEIPGGEHVVINSSTAPIIYNKGGSILRQIQGYIGDDNFQKGLRHYLSSHAYSCADSHHLWEAFEQVSDRPINAMMKSWIEQPGFPIIDVSISEDQIVLEQRRFSYLPLKSDQTWIIPVNIDFYDTVGKTNSITVLLDGPRTTVPIPFENAVYKVNSQHTGFYRVSYNDPSNLEKLGQRITDKTLPPEDRWGIVNDMFSLVLAGRIQFETYFDYLQYLNHEDSFLPLVSIANHLSYAHFVLPKAYKDRICSFACAWYESILERIGHEPLPNEQHTRSILRDQILFDAVKYGSQKVLDFAVKKFESLKNNEPVHPDIVKSILQINAWAGDKTTLDWLLNQFSISKIEHERLNILIALGAIKDVQQIKSVLQYILDTVPARNQFIPVVALSENPHALETVWQWYTDNLETIEQFHPMLYERVVGAIIPSIGIEKYDTVIGFFNHYMSQKDKAKDVILLSLEKLDINRRLHQAHEMAQ